MVGLANHFFLKNGKLDIYENGLIKIGLAIGIINLVIGFGVAFFLLKSASSEWPSLLLFAKEQGLFFFDYIKNHLNFFQRFGHGQGETI